MQRATGDLRVSARRRGDLSVLDGLRQAGCLKARFPRPVAAGWLDATLVNISGGVAGGDALDFAVSAGDGARMTVAAQSAERVYRALPGSVSRVRTAVVVGTGGSVEWLPQETILFDGCALDRRLTVDVAANGWFLGVETLIFGRAAMGERVRSAVLRDLIRVRRGDALLLHDAIRLEGEAASVLDRPAVAGGARAVATVVLVAAEAEARLDAVRAAADVAASAWNGMLVARILAAGSAAARADVVAVLGVLRDGRALPRAWGC